MGLAKPVNDYCQAMMDRFFAKHIPLPEKKNLPQAFTNCFLPFKHEV